MIFVPLSVMLCLITWVSKLICGVLPKNVLFLNNLSKNGFNIHWWSLPISVNYSSGSKIEIFKFCYISLPFFFCSIMDLFFYSPLPVAAPVFLLCQKAGWHVFKMFWVHLIPFLPKSQMRYFSKADLIPFSENGI